jgi:hypothetical protein
MPFHDDRAHADDDLDPLLEEARARWAAGGGDPAAISMPAKAMTAPVGTSAPAVN